MKKIEVFLLIFILSMAAWGCRNDPASDGNNNKQEERKSESTQSETIESDQTSEEIDYTCYDELIAQIADGLKNGFTEDEQMNMDISSVFLMKADYEKLGYLEKDIDHDGTLELILGANSEDTWDGIIYDIYTIKDGKMQHILDGWERNRYFLCSDGSIANEGANGADESIYAYYEYDGTSFLEDEYNISKLKECVIYDATTDPEHPWFYSTTSLSADGAKAITEEEANSIIERYQKMQVSLEYQQFEY